MIVTEAKEATVSIGIVTDEMQDPTKFGSQLFNKLDEVLQQSQLSKQLLGSFFKEQFTTEMYVWTVTRNPGKMTTLGS